MSCDMAKETNLKMTKHTLQYLSQSSFHNNYGKVFRLCTINETEKSMYVIPFFTI